MHDIDRTQAETAWETDEFEMDGGEFEYQDEGAWDGETDAVFNEADEMELAAELLEVSDEAELDQFIGRLVKRAGRALRTAIRSPIGRSLGGMLKGVARRALPAVSGAIDSVLPGAGGLAGSAITSAAGNLFGLELEGMSPEDQEFEVARRYVRLAGEAVKQAASAPAGASPQAVAKQAVTAAAQQHAPGLANGAGGASGRQAGGRARSGRWVRRGGVIILMGI
jgi:hypothetical protein